MPPEELSLRAVALYERSGAGADWVDRQWKGLMDAPWLPAVLDRYQVGLVMG